MRTNILLAIRNITKNRVNSVITVAGLSIAFACLLLIYLYVSQEFSYNDFHQNRDRLFRVNYTVAFADRTKQSTVLLDHKLSEVIKDKVPQIKRSTAFRSAQNPGLKFNNHNFEENVCITEPAFFEMFSFKFIVGNKDELFKNPDEIVISESLAAKFQATSACTKEALIGKPVFFMNTGDRPFVISAIMEDVPKNSSIQFDALIPYKYEGEFSQSCNMFGNTSIYYEINNKNGIHSAETRVAQTVREYYKGLVKGLQSRNIVAGTSDSFSPFVSSMNDVYLDKVDTGNERTNNKTSLYILSAIGLLILFIACSNFILLSLGQSLRKSGEVVVRKALGARNGNIFGLFFTENLLLTLLSLIFGSALCLILLPIFNQLSQNEIYTGLIHIPRILVFTMSCILLVVVSISVVPALKLIKVRPNMLASKSMGVGKKTNATSLFVTFQYGLSIILIILTISILRQTNYMKYTDLGFFSENIINLRINHLKDNDRLMLRDQLKKHAGIMNLTLTDRNYVSGKSGEFIKNAQGENIETRILKVDQNYIPTLGLTLIQGENFDEGNIKEDDRSVIINEKLVGHLGFNDEAIGQTVNLNGKDLRIIGIVKDFHYDSMKEKIEPLALCTNMGNNYSYILIKYSSAQLASIIPFIKSTWAKVVPDKELDIQFWDEQLSQRYQAEELWGRIIAYAAVIAILISSLGLFGFTLLGINMRVKEIGIRKVNGAKISEVMVMLNKDFIKWVVIAFLVAMPIAWYIMNKWLENFAYKTNLSWWIFALAGLIALVIALLTVSWQSWNAATRNPVEALRSE
jgi:putative ABC transport system permease protein